MSRDLSNGSHTRRLRAKRELKAFIDRTLARIGLHLSLRPAYAEDGLATIHDDHFRRTPSFRAAYARAVAAGHGVDPHFEWRVHVALWAARCSLRAPGAFVECGVNAGLISSAIMHALDWNRLDRSFFLVDTWAGPPSDQFNDAEIGIRELADAAASTGAYVTDLARVRANFAEWPRAVVVQGTVPDVLTRMPIDEVAFPYLDMNCAYPERAAFEFLWDRLAPGAFVLLDDYAFNGHAQQMLAMDAAAAAVGADILSLPTGQGLIMKYGGI